MYSQFLPLKVVNVFSSTNLTPIKNSISFHKKFLRTKILISFYFICFPYKLMVCSKKLNRSMNANCQKFYHIESASPFIAKMSFVQFELNKKDLLRSICCVCSYIQTSPYLYLPPPSFLQQSIMTIQKAIMFIF